MIQDLLYNPDAFIDWLLGWVNANVWQLTFGLSAAAIVLELLNALVVRLRHRAALRGHGVWRSSLRRQRTWPAPRLCGPT